MTEQPYQPPQPPNQPPGYGYPHPGATPPGGTGPYGAGPGGPYAQQGPYGNPGPYGYPGGPVPSGAYTGDPNAPYGYDPYGRPYSEKSKIVAGVLQLTLGGLGIGRFYLGHVGIGIAQLFTCGGLGIWSIVDGIMLLVGNSATDSDGRVLRG
ncbi:TM2 domain-containing protein [Streptomyces sp. NPDC048566]|uniref:TM2 domain-containing protein n=1 Tax=Streptomyces sp. NPDC048566 TaxID=3365569 RepID=UPI0037176EC7